MFITQTQGKPRLNRHIKANKTHIKTQNQKISKEKRRAKIRNFTSTLELSRA